MDYKELLNDFNIYRKWHTYSCTIVLIAAKWHYSISYMRKLVTKARHIYKNTA